MSDEQKTEQPTQKRIADGRKKGQTASSREITNVLMIISYTIIFAWFMPNIMYTITVKLKSFIEFPHQLIGMNILHIGSDLLGKIFRTFALPMLLVVITGILSNLVQNGFIFSAEPIIPKLSKISPLKGLKRVFSSKSIVELVSSILKLTLISILMFMIITSELTTITTLSNLSLNAVLHFIHKMIIKIMAGVIIVMGFIAVLDLIYRKFDHTKSLRMNKQEVKDEYKQAEGNPEMKAKLHKCVLK